MYAQLVFSLSGYLTFILWCYSQLATEENKNFRDRNVFIVLVPNKAIVQKAPEQPKKKEKPATEVSASV